jgi:hypothetical protein
MNKIFENERMFEEANARVAEATLTLAPEQFPHDFALELYCECANKLCLERVSIPPADYRSVKATANNFVVRAEHYLPEFERLIDKRAGYWIIKKRIEKLSKPFAV